MGNSSKEKAGCKVLRTYGDGSERRLVTSGFPEQPLGPSRPLSPPLGPSRPLSLVLDEARSTGRGTAGAGSARARLAQRAVPGTSVSFRARCVGPRLCVLSIDLPVPREFGSLH